MKRIALKIDVDTYHGTLTGVPALVEALRSNDAQGTFFFSLGPDNSGRDDCHSAIRHYYDLRTRLYGRLLPSPNIGKRCAGVLRQVAEAGFETGLHAWNRSLWEEKILSADTPWVDTEMHRSQARFTEIFATRASAHAAPGWRMNRHALRMTQRLGFSYASDSRGTHPFIPVIDGEIVACPQLPTTLPTLDETLAVEPGLSPAQAVERILQGATDIEGDHVFTLRAEIEGMKLQSAFAQLLAGWKTQGIKLVALRDLRADLDLGKLPRHSVHLAEIPGRSGLRLIQGARFPDK